MTSEPALLERSESNRPTMATEPDAFERTGIRMGGRRVEIEPHACFACGALNANGLRLELHSSDGRCWTELELPERFQGWDGIAHGGILATVIDEVMAWAVIEQDNWGVTARMTIEYKRPAAVGARIRGEGWVVRARRRLVETAARLTDAATGEVIATAEGLYVAAPEEKKRELKAKYAFRLAADDATAVRRADRPGSVDA